MKTLSMHASSIRLLIVSAICWLMVLLPLFGFSVWIGPSILELSPRIDIVMIKKGRCVITDAAQLRQLSKILKDSLTDNEWRTEGEDSSAENRVPLIWVECYSKANQKEPKKHLLVGFAIEPSMCRDKQNGWKTLHDDLEKLGNQVGWRKVDDE